MIKSIKYIEFYAEIVQLVRYCAYEYCDAADSQLYRDTDIRISVGV